MLTPREVEIVRILVEHQLSSGEAAAALHLSEKTVDTHRANIHRKLSTRLHLNRVTMIDMVLFAMANGIVDTGKIWGKYRLPMAMA